MSKNFDSVKFIKKVLSESDPSVDTRPSTAMYDLFVKPQGLMLQPINDNSELIQSNLSIANIDEITEDAADALIANFFLNRRTGGKANGEVRFYFIDPVAVSVPENSIVVSDTGLKYKTVGVSSVSKEEMALNRDGSLYFISSSVEAYDYGTEYNVLPGGIVSTDVSIDNLAKVSNQFRISGGESRETNTQLKSRAETAVSVRNLLSSRSIDAVLLEEFPEIQSITTAGMHDPEMLRDIIETQIDSTSFMIHIGGKTDIYAHIPELTNRYVDVTATDNVAASNTRAIAETGFSVGTKIFQDPFADFILAGVSTDDTLNIKNGKNNGEYTVTTINGATSITVDKIMTIPETGLAYEITKVSGWSSPVVQIESVERLDPSTSEPTGEKLYNGVGFIENPVILNSEALQPVVMVDSDNVSHHAYVIDGVIYYSKYSSAGNELMDPIAISDPLNASFFPRISITGTNDAFVIWEETDSLTSEKSIVRAVIGNDGIVSHSFEAVKSDIGHNYTSPSVSINQYGANLAYVYDDTEAVYMMVDSTSWITQSTSAILTSGTSDIHSTDVSSNNEKSYIVINVDNVDIEAYIYDRYGSPVIPVSIVSSSGIENKMPKIAVGADGYSYITWVSMESNVVSLKMDEFGSVVIAETIVMSGNEAARNPSIVIDVSNKIHIAAILDEENSGDIFYSKLDNDYSVLVSKFTVNDQNNNSDTVSITSDSERRILILWDSFDRTDNSIYWSKLQPQDYRINPLNSNYRYSIKEILNIKIDPSFEGDRLRFTYNTPNSIDSISEYVFGSTSRDRVTNADTIVKSSIPCFVDIEITYSGDDDFAVESIVDYINNNTTGELAVSDIMSTIPLDQSSRVETPFSIFTERHDIDGEIISLYSDNIVTEPRTVRFIARNIVVK